MEGAIIIKERIRVANTRPQQGSSYFGHDGMAQLVELGSTSCFNVTEVKEESKNTWSTLAVSLVLQKREMKRLLVLP